MQAVRIARLVKLACEEKKGDEIVVLDLRRLASIASYFVISSGNSTRHVRAIADHVMEKLAEKRIRGHHVEGAEEASWILLDYGAVIIHVFYHETRRFYNLERLWGNARRL